MRKIAGVFAVFVCALLVTTVLVASEAPATTRINSVENRIGGNSEFVRSDSDIPEIDGRKSYIILMDLDPVVAYEGDVAGFPATKARTGLKVDHRSEDARRYQGHLRARHDKSL